MKTRFFFFCFACFCLLSGCTGDQLSTGSAVVTLKDADLSWSATSCTAVLGTADNEFPELSNPHDLAVSFASSDEQVATVSSTGIPTLLTAGTATISVASAATGKYEAGGASYVLTVVKNSDGLSWSSVSATVTIGAEDNAFPTLNNPGGQSVRYSSSNESVATISLSEGIVTLLSAGETTITATAQETDDYASSSASYVLNVQEAEGGLLSASLSWSASSCTATLCSEDNVFPTLSNEHGLPIIYASSDETVATISQEGTITLVQEGTVAITANSEATDVYAAGSAYYTLKVVRHEVVLSWSESSFSAALDDTNDFPVLQIAPSVSAISEGVVFSSSSPDVATIDATGNISLLTAGTTTISAIFEGNTQYKSASASYALTVRSGADEGAGTYVYPSSGGATTDGDEISNTTFTRKITITYSTSGTASVVGDYYGYVSVSGNHVTAANTGDEYIVYTLTGTASDGSFKLYSSKKQAIHLSGVSLTCSSGAAINNQSGKRTFVYVEGSNTLSDASSASYSTSADEDMKGVFFSEGQLVFSGSGYLSITACNAQGKSALVSDDYIRVMNSPSLTVQSGASAGHGIRGKEYVQLSSGVLSVSTSANMKKGIGSDDYVLIEGGSHTIIVSGGTAYDSDDAEYKGSAGIKADNYFGMTGGTVSITNTGGGGKGISAGSYDYNATTHAVADSYITGGKLTIETKGKETNDVSTKGIKIGWATKNGTDDHATVTAYAGNLLIDGGTVSVTCTNAECIESKGDLTINSGSVYASSEGDDAINCQAEMNINGGYVYAFSSANDALDANKDLKLNGGYVFAVTTKGTPEVAIDANTELGYKLYINQGATVVAYGGLERSYSASQSVYTMSCTAGSWNALYNSGSYLCAFRAPSGISSVTVSAPSLSAGYKGVSVSGTTYAEGYWAVSGISGGTSVSLKSSSSGGPGGRQ
ncbi:MAG: carbohydrate-binding domain-containing protein [Bacteroidales bacterium]|nr:carbohydrate-binding domain-containing protein [Bacteroidales bacterium]